MKYELYFTNLSDTQYDRILNMPVTDMLSNHVLSLNTKKAQDVYQESLKLGNKGILWGDSLGLSHDTRANRKVQHAKIQVSVIRRLTKNDSFIPVIIDKSGHVWTGDLKTAIAFELVEPGIRLKDANLMIFDYSSKPAKVSTRQKHGIWLTDSNNIVETINKMASNHEKQCLYASDRLYGLHYTVGEFMEDNNINSQSIVTYIGAK